MKCMCSDRTFWHFWAALTSCSRQACYDSTHSGSSLGEQGDRPDMNAEHPATRGHARPRMSMPRAASQPSPAWRASITLQRPRAHCGVKEHGERLTGTGASVGDEVCVRVSQVCSPVFEVLSFTHVTMSVLFVL